MSIPTTQIALDSIRLGPILCDALPEELEERVRTVYDSCGRFTGDWEEFEADFRRERNVVAEIETWEAMDAAFRLYFGPGDVPTMKAKRVVGCLSLIAAGYADNSKKMVRDLRKLYNGPVRPLRLGTSDGRVWTLHLVPLPSAKRCDKARKECGPARHGRDDAGHCRS